jgi:5'-nucleotidase
MSTWKSGLLVGAATLALLPAFSRPAAAANTTVTLIGFSDYHSHAVPLYSEGATDQGGVARTLAYLKARRADTPNLLVLSGGDTMNKGIPTWSDEYQCVEWPWFNGLIDAMALGNHDFDYGQAAFQACAAKAAYPVLSANYVGPDGQPLLKTADGKPYFVKEVGGVKIGAFALAGNDFPSLVAKANRAPDAVFADRVATAKAIISTLRDQEHVQAVVLFGHASREDDTALAQAAPGIDLILGTHSHYKGEGRILPNTNTYYISPFQYLTYLSQVQMTFSDGKLSGVSGQLVKMDSSRPTDSQYGPQVNQLEQALETKRPDRFAVIGTAATDMIAEPIDDDETVLGNWALETVRQAAHAHVFFSTASSFRATIPQGPITTEGFFTAIPYKNGAVVVDMTGQQLLDLIDYGIAKKGTDSFLQESGVRFSMAGGTAANVQIVTDPLAAKPGYEALDLTKTYKVGVTDFMQNVAAGYKDLIAKGSNATNTGIDIGTLLIATIKSGTPISGALDGRMGTPVAAPGGTPGMPTTGTPIPWWDGVLLALGLLALGGAARAYR